MFTYFPTRHDQMEGLAWLTVNPIVVIFSRDLLSISLRSIELYQGNGNRQLGGQTSNSNILQVVFHFHDYTIYVKEFYYVATI